MNFLSSNWNLLAIERLARQSYISQWDFVQLISTLDAGEVIYDIDLGSEL